MAKKPPLAEIAAKAGLSSGLIPGGGSLNVIISGLQERRRYAAEHSVGAIAERVGEDVFFSLLERDPELEALLWNALQAIVASGYEAKCEVLRRVVAQAFTSSEPIDEEQLVVMALTDLDAPHIRSLSRFAAVPPLKRGNGQHEYDPQYDLRRLCENEHPSVVAALIRTGALFPDENNRFFRFITVAGVTEFGHALLSHIEDADSRSS